MEQTAQMNTTPSSMAMLFVDDSRLSEYGDATGIYVRARLAGEWGSYDIATLQPASLLTWLRSRGGENVWAESTLFHLLGYDLADYSALTENDD